MGLLSYDRMPGRALLGVSSLALFAVPALAQQNATTEPGQRPTIAVEESATPPAPAYESTDVVATGRSVISQEAVQSRQTGNGDAMELLKILPHVQFSRSQYSTDATDIQDIRPSDISISGGRYYDNYFAIDGVGANSRLDVVDTITEFDKDYSEILCHSKEGFFECF